MHRVQNELRHLLESLAILVSGPNRYVESHENSIKDRIREILAENKDQALVFRLSYRIFSTNVSLMERFKFCFILLSVRALKIFEKR